MNLIEPKEICFDIYEDVLLEAFRNCYLGLGTTFYPISLNSFIDFSHTHFEMIYPGQEVNITFKMIKDTNKEVHNITNFRILNSTFTNVGKEFIEGIPALNPWESLIVTNDNQIISPDGTLQIKPVDNTVSFAIWKDLSTETPTHYISYSILFEAEIDNHFYYFIIDPLIRVSSTPPPHNV